VVRGDGPTSGDDRRARLWLFLQWGPTLGGCVPGKVSRRLAIVVWNASLLPQGEQSEALQPIVDMLPEDDQNARRELAAAIDMLLARKRRYFPKNTRVILDYQITDSADMLHLDVISTPGKAYHPPQ
jgi:hypothetical protein